MSTEGNAWAEGYVDWLLSPLDPHAVKDELTEEMARAELAAHPPIHVALEVDEHGQILQGHMRAEVLKEHLEREHQRKGRWHGEPE